MNRVSADKELENVLAEFDKYCAEHAADPLLLAILARLRTAVQQKARRPSKRAPKEQPELDLPKIALALSTLNDEGVLDFVFIDFARRG
jgi:hypothetical protein